MQRPHPAMLGKDLGTQGQAKHEGEMEDVRVCPDPHPPQRSPSFLGQMRWALLVPFCRSGNWTEAAAIGSVGR